MHSEIIRLRTKEALNRQREWAARLAALYGLPEQAQRIEAAAQKAESAARRLDVVDRDLAGLLTLEAVADLLDKIAGQVAAGHIPPHGQTK